MKIVVLSFVVVLFVMPLTAAEQAHRISEINQPAVDRQIDRLGDSTLNQAPNQVSGVFSDEDCDICGQPQVLAENFTVITAGMGFDLEQIVIWGGYFDDNIPLAVDDFDVLVHSDAAGIPGAVVCTETSIVPTSRTDTGVDLFGVDEYIVTLDLAVACSLADGTYWIEIYNNTAAGSSTNDWFWELGNVDGVNGTSGGAYAFEAPGATWNLDGAQDFAVQLNGTVVPVELQSFSIE
ncbi:MAG: hypothetical protein DRJ65_17970 [Acidobacteria bacterium]|nr:MAG: hypothetical protein DRJ65_17970 [Acidobacteriota bacterium]